MKRIYATVAFMALAAMLSVYALLNSSVRNILKKSQSPPSAAKIGDNSNKPLHAGSPCNFLTAAVNDQPTLKERIFGGGKSVFGSEVVGGIASGIDEFYADAKH